VVTAPEGMRCDVDCDSAMDSSRHESFETNNRVAEEVAQFQSHPWVSTAHHAGSRQLHHPDHPGSNARINRGRLPGSGSGPGGPWMRLQRATLSDANRSAQSAVRPRVESPGSSCSKSQPGIKFNTAEDKLELAPMHLPGRKVASENLRLSVPTLKRMEAAGTLTNPGDTTGARRFTWSELDCFANARRIVPDAAIRRAAEQEVVPDAAAPQRPALHACGVLIVRGRAVSKVVTQLGRLAMVVLEHPAQPLIAPNLSIQVGCLSLRNGQLVADALVISFKVGYAARILTQFAARMLSSAITASRSMSPVARPSRVSRGR